VQDFRFAAATIFVLALAIAIGLSGLASFEPYPLLHLDAGLADVVVSALLAVAMAAPFGPHAATRDRWEDEA
jgi:hypothetical protein